MRNEQLGHARQVLALVGAIVLAMVATGCGLPTPAGRPGSGQHLVRSRTSPVRTRIEDRPETPIELEPDPDNMLADNMLADNMLADNPPLPTPALVIHDSRDSSPEPEASPRLACPQPSAHPSLGREEGGQSSSKDLNETLSKTNLANAAQPPPGLEEDRAEALEEDAKRAHGATWQTLCKAACAPLVLMRRCRPRRCLEWLRCRHSAMGVNGMPQPALEPPLSRFHSVPTQPVFTPRYDVQLQTAAVLAEPLPSAPRPFPTDARRDPLERPAANENW